MEDVNLTVLFFSTLLAAWKQVFDMVQEARIDRHLKLVPFAGFVLVSCIKIIFLKLMFPDNTRYRAVIVSAT